MAVRTGAEFLEGLRSRPRSLWLQGEPVGDVPAHPVLGRTARTLAWLYDLQHTPEHRDALTYVREPEEGEERGDPERRRTAMAYLQPRSVEDLHRKGRAIKLVADLTAGMLGRSPDFLNVALAGLAAAHDYFDQNDSRFGANLQRYYRHVRDHDLTLTHTLITPQVNRARGPQEQADPYVVAGIVEERDAGFVVRGARMLATLAPFADELFVFPSTFLQNAPGADRYAFAFALPCDTPGLTFICRESFDAGGSPYDHPLASRFEEQDAVVVFNDVLVPWERTFLYRDVALCNGVFRDTHAILHMMHQYSIRMLAKAEFLLGVGLLLAETIGADGFTQVQDRLADMINQVESLRALIDSAEARAGTGPGGTVSPHPEPLWVIRTTFPVDYPRLVQHLHQLGAGGLMMLPTEADLRGPLGPDVRRYYQAATAGAEERIALFRLAWDIAGTTWGSRQELYERFFSGDPVRLMLARYQAYDKTPYKDRVRAFLARTRESGEV